MHNKYLAFCTWYLEFRTSTEKNGTLIGSFCCPSISLSACLSVCEPFCLTFCLVSMATSTSSNLTMTEFLNAVILCDANKRKSLKLWNLEFLMMIGFCWCSSLSFVTLLHAGYPHTHTSTHHKWFNRINYGWNKSMPTTRRSRVRPCVCTPAFTMCFRSSHKYLNIHNITPISYDHIIIRSVYILGMMPQ